MLGIMTILSLILERIALGELLNKCSSSRESFMTLTAIPKIFLEIFGLTATLFIVNVELRWMMTFYENVKNQHIQNARSHTHISTFEFREWHVFATILSYANRCYCYHFEVYLFIQFHASTLLKFDGFSFYLFCC